jgi:hypothetical protein
MNKKLLFPALLLCISLLTACRKINPEPEVPSYIHIPAINLTTDYSVQGSSKADIFDAWVYIDGALVGTFEMPVTFPVLKTGKHRILIRAGVVSDDNVLNRERYAFYGPYEADITLEAGKTTSIVPPPSVEYFPSTVFEWKEDFETGISLDSTSTSTSAPALATDSASVYEGQRSMMITLDETHNFFECKSSQSFPVIRNSAVYLELHYSSNHEIVVGIFANYQGQPSSQTSAKRLESTGGAWKKVYIDLSTEVSRDAIATTYSVFFGAVKDASIPEGIIYIDNIKLVHN